MSGAVAYALGLSLFAGASTGVGSLLAITTRKPSPRLLAAGLGLSAGVMIYVSLVELLPEGHALLDRGMPGRGGWIAIAAFFLGTLFIGGIDLLVPSELNPHETHADEESRRRAQLMRTGLLTAFALALHNFPEGFATFMAALSSPQMGVPIAVAVAIHNIPEGVAVAVPIYYATRSRRTAFLYSFASGLAEPVGAVLAYLLLAPYLSDALTGFVLAGIAGIMVYICLDELLPSAREYGEHHIALSGVMVGMLIMAVSLQALA